MKRFVTAFALVFALTVPSYAADYSTDFDANYTIATDFQFRSNYLNAHGFTAIGTGSYGVGLVANDNSQIDVRTGTTNNRYETLTIETNSTATRVKPLGSQATKMKWRSMLVDSSLTYRLDIMGLGNSIFIGSNYTSTGGAHGAFFRYDVQGSTGTIKAVTKNGTSETVTDTGVTPGLDVQNVFEIVATNGQVDFYIDGSSVASHTTNITSTNIGPILGVTNRQAASKGISTEWFKYESPR